MAAHKDKIKAYALLVTCGNGGLEGAEKDAIAEVGKSPTVSQQFLSKEIKQNEFNLDGFAE